MLPQLSTLINYSNLSSNYNIYIYIYIYIYIDREREREREREKERERERGRERIFSERHKETGTQWTEKNYTATTILMYKRYAFNTASSEVYKKLSQVLHEVGRAELRRINISDWLGEEHYALCFKVYDCIGCPDNSYQTWFLID